MTTETLELDQSFLDRATDKVKSILFGLIPDDKVTSIVQTQFDSYFVKKHESGYGSSKTNLTKFEQLVRDEVQAMVKKGVTERVTNIHQTFFMENQAMVDDEVKKIVRECSVAVMHSVSQDLVGNTLQRIANENGQYAQSHNGLGQGY